MNLVDIESGVGDRRPDPPQQAEPVTMRMIECLEIFIADPTTSMVAKHLAAAYLFCCYAVMRVEQAQECWIDTVRDDEFTEGYVCLDKNSVRSKMQPRPFWAPLYGITNSKLYFTTLLDSLKDVTDKCYISRGEPGTCRCEIGRWSHSVAQLPALRPETNILRKHRARASTLPDLYPKNNATQRHLAILGRQIKALRDFSVKCGPGKLPLHGGF